MNEDKYEWYDFPFCTLAQEKSFSLDNIGLMTTAKLTLFLSLSFRKKKKKKKKKIVLCMTDNRAGNGGGLGWDKEGPNYEGFVKSCCADHSTEESIHSLLTRDSSRADVARRHAVIF